ncbi:MAG TPA: hypothetical protein VED87_07230 [Methylocystis sp.]|nr:hypothetical protein [Methylocystis sp.]
MTTPRDRELLLNALLDGELDAKDALEIERELAQDAELARELAGLEALRGALRAHAPREPAPPDLRARVLAACDERQELHEERHAPRASWRGYGAAIAATLLLTLGLQHFLAMEEAPNTVLQSAVFAHMRGQISGQPIDVASSDRHTVKPWLSAKLPVDAIVVDLAGEGFPLIGGRVDIVGGGAAPTLVYKRREHLLSLTQLPASAGDFPSTPQLRSQNGYPAAVWSAADRAFIAVSDVAPAELLSFAEAFRLAALREQDVKSR